MSGGGTSCCCEYARPFNLRAEDCESNVLSMSLRYYCHVLLVSV
jgi:hypothetical protein